MYDHLLKLVLPVNVKLLEYPDYVAVVIVAKHLDEIKLAFDRLSKWSTGGLLR